MVTITIKITTMLPVKLVPPETMLSVCDADPGC